MKKLIMRLDDAAEQMNYKNWKRMENLLDMYNIKPIVGVIPFSKDPEFIKYKKVNNFWKLVSSWEKKGWIIAMHGYQHLFNSKNSGINPVNDYSEFAGLSLKKQSSMLRKGYNIFLSKKIEPKVFFAPAHTFDENTIIALKNETKIRIISDTIANDIYYENGIYYIPQQSGKVRKLPFRITTFCYHPNIMTDEEFVYLESFLRVNYKKFCIPKIKNRNKSLYDRLIKKTYFVLKKIKRILK